MFKALINKITAVFAQPKIGEVVPVQEKVEAVMNAPIVEITPKQQPKPQPKKTPAAKKTAPKKNTSKKKQS